MDKKGTIAIIPARGGSKGIPRKNVKLLNGIPLIAYTIRAALQSGCFDRVIVSTEDEEIAGVSRKFGAEVPCMRPRELAADTTPTEPVLVHMVKYLEDNEKYPVNVVVLLQATSPMRDAEDIRRAMVKFSQTGADSLLTVSEDRRFYWDKSGSWFIPRYTVRPRRQEMTPAYKENGAIYVTKKEILLKYNNRLGGNISAAIMDEWKSTEIDDEFEFWLVEQIIKKRLSL